MLLSYAGFTNPGNRSQNEDAYRAEQRGDSFLFVLADGLGGHGHGEIASETAVQSMTGRFLWDTEPEGFLERAIVTAQGAVEYRQQFYDDVKRMSTTVVCLRIDGNVAGWVHIGDSRLYMFRDGEVLTRTADHSVPQMLFKLGDISEEEIRRHPERNRLLATVGMPWSSYQPFTLSERYMLQEGDAFLLCSDGFWEYILEKDMCETLKNSKDTESWLEAMTRIVRANGKNENMDNFTALCIRNNV